MPARPLHRAWSFGSLPPVEWFTGAQDVVHGTNFVVPPARRAARVLTIHDLTSVRYPELCDDYTRTFPALVRRALAEGAWVHTPSRFVASEVVDLLDAPPERVVPVHHGIPTVEDLPCDGLPPELSLPEGPYVLALGTVEPRKDLPTLVRAFDLMAADQPELHLVVAGPDGWGVEAYEETVARCRFRDRVVRVGWVGGALRSALLRNARIYAYPSLYEGFGFPPLEAMSVGVPVVTTDAGALPEVVGQAARIVRPGDVQGLADALRELATDERARSDLISRGSQRVKAFSWESTAEGLSDLYAAAVASR